MSEELKLEQKFSHIKFCKDVDKADKEILIKTLTFIIKHNSLLANNILKNEPYPVFELELNDDLLIVRTINELQNMDLQSLRDMAKSNNIKNMELKNQLVRKICGHN